MSSLPDGVVVVSAAQTDAAGNVGSGTEHHQRCHAAGGDRGHCATNQPRESGQLHRSQWQLFGKQAPGDGHHRGNHGFAIAHCTAGSWSATAINATSVPVGTVTVLASQTDAAGNTGSGTRDTVKDVTAPAVTVSTAPVINASNQVAYGGVTGTCSENGLPVSVVIGNVGAVPEPNLRWRRMERARDQRLVSPMAQCW